MVGSRSLAEWGKAPPRVFMGFFFGTEAARARSSRRAEVFDEACDHAGGCVGFLLLVLFLMGPRVAAVVLQTTGLPDGRRRAHCHVSHLDEIGLAMDCWVRSSRVMTPIMSAARPAARSGGQNNQRSTVPVV